MNPQAVIILHEIYGVNAFINYVCEKMRDAGYAVYCPNLIGSDAFAYADSSKAYEWFVNQVGFEIYKEIKNTVQELKKSYEKVFIVGFSVGATIVLIKNPCRINTLQGFLLFIGYPYDCISNAFLIISLSLVYMLEEKT